MTNNIDECIEGVMLIDGALGAALIRWTTGEVLGSAGADLDADGVADLVLAKVKVMWTLNMLDPIEDILITLDTQYHLIRLARSHPTLFLYVLLDRSRANLALARIQLETAEETLVVAETHDGESTSARERGV